MYGAGCKHGNPSVHQHCLVHSGASIGGRGPEGIGISLHAIETYSGMMAIERI